MTDSGDLVLDGAPSGIPPAISEALPREIINAIKRLEVARELSGGDGTLERRQEAATRRAELYAAIGKDRAAILSALPREEPQPAPRQPAGHDGAHEIDLTRPAPSGEALEAKIRERAVTHFGSLESWVPLRDVITLIRAQFGSPPSPTSKEG